MRIKSASTTKINSNNSTTQNATTQQQQHNNTSEQMTISSYSLVLYGLEAKKQTKNQRHQQYINATVQQQTTATITLYY